MTKVLKVDILLKQLSKKCWEELHRPMLYVGSKDTRETYYICQSCLSKEVLEHPELMTKIVILRGVLTEEAEEKVRQWLDERAKEDFCLKCIYWNEKFGKERGCWATKGKAKFGTRGCDYREKEREE